jgi:thiol-disulfide isomerase/thioredoxin
MFNSLSLLVLLTLPFLYLCAKNFDLPTSDVALLSKSNFKSMVNGPDDIFFVMFYAPWCKHSKDFAPTFDKMATFLADSNIPLGKVNCVEENELWESEGIESLGFPAFKAYVRGGDPILFDGERDPQEMITWLNTINGNSIKSLEQDLGGIDSFKSNYLTDMSPIVIIFLNKEDKPNSMLKLSDEVRETSFIHLEYACKKIGSIRCAISHDMKLLTEISPLHSNGNIEIVMLRKFVGEKELIVAPLTSVMTSGNEMYSWVQKYSYPNLVQFKYENEQHMFSNKRSGYNTHVLIILDPASDNADETLDGLRDLGSTSDYLGKCVFIHIDPTGNYYFFFFFFFLLLLNDIIINYYYLFLMYR